MNFAPHVACLKYLPTYMHYNDKMVSISKINLGNTTHSCCLFLPRILKLKLLRIDTKLIIGFVLIWSKSRLSLISFMFCCCQHLVKFLIVLAGVSASLVPPVHHPGPSLQSQHHLYLYTLAQVH